MTEKEYYEKIQALFKINYTPSMVVAQTKKYRVERGWSYKEIARAFAYYVLVQKREPELKYGIGIVATIMDEANRYFRGKELQAAKQKKQAERLLSNENDYIICEKPIKRKKSLRRNLSDITKLGGDG